MMDEAIVLLVELFLWPMYLGRKVKVTRKGTLGAAGLEALTTWGKGADGQDVVLVNADLTGWALLQTLLHEAGHMRLGCLKGPSGAEAAALVVQALGVDGYSDVASTALQRRDMADEQRVDRWADREATRWWDRILRARANRASWRRFLGELDRQVFGSSRRSGLDEARRLAGLTEVQLLIADLEAIA